MPDPTKDKSQAQEGEVVDKPNKKAEKPKGALNDKDKRDLTLAVRKTETSVMNPVEYEQMRLMANDMFASGALPNSYENAQQVFMAIQLGKLMGFNANEAIQNGYYVNGRFQVWGKALPTALRRHGWRYQFSGEDGNKIHGVFKHIQTGEVIEDDYSFQDAVASGFTTDNYGKMKFGWKEGANRKRKLRYGLIAQVVNTYIPEVLGGVADIAEYSNDYIEGQTIQDDNNEARRVKTDAISDKVKNFELKDTKAKAVETEKPGEAA